MLVSTHVETVCLLSNRKSKPDTHVDLTLEPGKIIGLLGPNGSGKTTFIKLINQLLVPDEGTLLIDGNAPGVESKSIISYLPEKTYLDENQKI